MLFNQPQVQVRPPVDGSGDGTYLHEDQVFQQIVQSLTPWEIYKENKEFIENFTRTVINYSPISINVMDFWSKIELQQVVIPLPGDEDIYDMLPDDKIYDDGLVKAFFINSVIRVQEYLAIQYLNNIYTTALETKYDHNLRIKLYKHFRNYGIPFDDKNLLFNKINKLFKEERFITNKEYNMKKGKIITHKYAAQAAHDAEIEGPLVSNSFFLNYYSMDNTPGEFHRPLSYRIESTILPDVFNSFVKPLAHPLGMGLQYDKICKLDFTDRVLSTIRWTADKVTVKCTNSSDTSPFTPPGSLYPWKEDDDWTAFIEQSKIDCPGYNPYDDTTWTCAAPYNDKPTRLDTTYIDEQYIPDKPYDGVAQNTENVVMDNTLLHPWDENQNPYLPEIVFATNNGYGLNAMIADMDEGYGNILKDIETGQGYNEYAGMNFTKYIFENGNYLIEYDCIMENNEIKRTIEYYRYDVFDTSIHFNTVDALNPLLYPNSPSNIVNGLLPVSWDPTQPLPIRWFTHDEDPNNLQTPVEWPSETPPGVPAGLDIGMWHPNTSGAITPGWPAWDEDTNIANTMKQFTNVYTLIARFIETRKCITNVYNLEQVVEPSLREEFSVVKINYQDNIIHDEELDVNGDIIKVDATNVIHKTYTAEGLTDENTANKYHNKRR